MEGTEESVSKLEDKTVGISIRQQKEKRLGGGTSRMRDYNKGVLEGVGRREGQKKYSKK